MSKKDLYVKALAAAILTAGIATAALNVNAAGPAPKPAGADKCYGIAKQGMNDCASTSHACAGTATKSGDASDFLYVLGGTCQKIIGGITK